MLRCGQCLHYKRHEHSEAVGQCAMSNEGVSLGGVQQYKQVRYHTDASKCKMFTKLENPPTDRKEHLWEPYLRGYEDFEEKRADTAVDAERLKEEKYWG